MKNQLIAVLAMSVLLLASCDREIFEPAQDPNSPQLTENAKADGMAGPANEDGNLWKRGSNNGKGKGKPSSDPPPDTTVADPFVVTYKVLQYDDWDALYKFHISESGTLIQFETDPTVTSWGTDHWGAWADPYEFKDGIVNVISGLSFTTYTFKMISSNVYDVSKRIIRQPYPSGTPDTTFFHPGTYELVQ